MSSHQFHIGQRVRVARVSDDVLGSDTKHMGRCGSIVGIDHDGDLKLELEPDGTTTGWISPERVDLISNIGWDFCQQHLAQDVLQLLQSFEGTDMLSLRTSVKHRILAQFEDLAERIRSHTRAQANADTAAPKDNTP